MPILNYTTKVAAAKTAQDIVQLLAQKGAEEVHQRFTAGKPSGIAFAMRVLDEPVYFALPVDVEGVHAYMRSRARGRTFAKDQSERIAWRIVKDWVEVQLALVECGQAKLAQVFMPYALEPGGTRTMFEAFEEARWHAHDVRSVRGRDSKAARARCGRGQQAIRNREGGMIERNATVP